MKFEEALNEVLEKVMPQKPGITNVISPKTADIAALIWNMMAVSQNQLDDFVHIQKPNNDVISIPITKEPKTKEPEGQKSTGKTANNVNPKVDDGKENKKTTAATE